MMLVHVESRKAWGSIFYFGGKYSFFQIMALTLPSCVNLTKLQNSVPVIWAVKWG
jgi:hypothetical protein